MMGEKDFNELVGKTLISVDVDGDERVTFTTSDYHVYVMGHYQDCCEAVNLDEVIGDWEDVLFSPILLAEEVTNKTDPPYGDPESYTWTFYKLVTQKGKVTLRWYGQSNGYHSESVDFYRIEDSSLREYVSSIRKGVLNEERKC
jgi:hypothetical protein